MKVDLKIVLKDYEGQEMQASDKPGDLLTIRRVVFESLNSTLAEEVLTNEDKARIYAIGNKLYGGKDVINLTNSEIQFTIERANKILLPLPLGRLLDVLDPKDTGDENDAPIKPEA